MKPILKVLLVMAVMIALATAVAPAHHAAPASGPYASALTDLTVGNAQAQCCPYQYCEPEFGPYPSSCTGTTEPEYCEILLNHQTGQRFCGSEYCLP
jgi:hypothetical protein